MSRPLAEQFERFAESECKDSSLLYYVLSRAVAQDNAMLGLASEATRGQPVPNLFFAAAHHLLLAGKTHPLCEYYPTLVRDPRNPAGAFPSFRDFVMGNREEVVHLLKTRLVQTNEASRSAYLFPALVFAARHFENRPLALVEIGSSAGLNLLWDRYRYSYGTGSIYGDANSPVLITSTFRGRLPDALSDPMPRVSHRIGLDLNTVDATDPDQAAWLRALVWPEHVERRALMDAALALRARTELDLREGDGFGMMPGLSLQIPDDSLLCIYHTHVANQISEEARLAFLSLIDDLGRTRDLVHVFNNIKPTLHLTAFRGSARIDLPLAKTDAHARWIEWLADDAVRSH